MRMDRSPGTLPERSVGRLTYLPVVNGVFGTAPRDTAAKPSRMYRGSPMPHPMVRSPAVALHFAATAESSR